METPPSSALLPGQKKVRAEKEYMAWALWPILLFFGSNPNILLMGVRGNEGVRGVGQQAETSIAFYLGALLCYALGAIGLIVRLRGNVLPALKVVPVWLNVCLALASIAWSVQPADTISRCIGLVGTTLAAMFVGTFSVRQQARAMVGSFGLILVVSLLMIVAVPSLGVSMAKGWNARGIYVHKNLFGWASALFFIVAMGSLRGRMVTWGRGVLVCILALACAALSGSATGILAIVVAVLLYGILGFIRMTGKFRGVTVWITFLGIAAIISIAGLILPYVLDAFDKTATLSGRAQIWAALVPALQQRWLQGWGFGDAFWKDPISADFMDGVYFAGNAQNGYIELFIQLGAIGFVLYFVPFIAVVAKMISRATLGDFFSEMFAVMLMVYLFCSISAPILMPVNQIYWAFIVLAYCYHSGLSTDSRLVARARVEVAEGEN